MSANGSVQLKKSELVQVKEITYADSSKGDKYFKGLFTTKGGESVFGIMFKVIEGELKVGMFINIEFTTELFKDNLQYRIISYKIENTISQELKNDYIKSSKHDMNLMFNELKTWVEDYVKNPTYKYILDALLFNNQDNLELFKKGVASKRVHHNYQSGLLEHTWKMVKNSLIISKIYDNIDISLLVSGCILHDFGKLFEYDEVGNYTNDGKLLGHISMCAGLIQEQLKYNTDSSVNQEDGKLLIHLILSHHGKLEFGSPVLPKIKEAFILNFVDDFDSKMNLIDNTLEGLEKGQWSNKVPFLQNVELLGK